MPQNVLDVQNRAEFRQWLMLHAQRETECWVWLKRGAPTDHRVFYYLDAVEEALCFGWIDSTLKMIDGRRMQRFTPRRKNSLWTELNKERVRRLERLGLMMDAGRAVLPDMDASRFVIDADIQAALQDASCLTLFESFPPLYQRIRAYNVAFYKKRNPAEYQKALTHLIEQTRSGKMYGEWDDYGRLTEQAAE